MKLYATLQSERGGRNARKGANKELLITLTRGNSKAFEIVFKNETLLVYDANTFKILLEHRNGVT